MKKIFVIVSLFALCLCGINARAQVAESADWAMRIKAEGLNKPGAGWALKMERTYDNQSFQNRMV